MVIIPKVIKPGEEMPEGYELNRTLSDGRRVLYPLSARRLQEFVDGQHTGSADTSNR